MMEVLDHPPRKTFQVRQRVFIAAMTLGLLLLVTGVTGVTAGFEAPSDVRRRPEYWKSHITLRSRELDVPNSEGAHNGDITFYEPSMGSCGIQSSAGEGVVAISAVLFDAYPESTAQGGNPNMNPLCGKMIKLERIDETGLPCSVDAKIVDRCASCAESDLDVTEHVFRQLAAPGLGRVQATWSWL